MGDAAYRDEEAALSETRARLLEARRGDETRAAAIAQALGSRAARVVGGALALAASTLLALLDVVAPVHVAGPGGTWLGRALVCAPLLALIVAPVARAWARSAATFEPSSDVRADVERLREAPDLEPIRRRAAALERASFVLPLVALALWPPLLAMHGAIELARTAPRFYEVMPSLELRAMQADEAVAQLLSGGAMLALFSLGAYAVAIVRTAGRGFPAAADPPAFFGRFFGGIFFGAALGQLTVSWMQESATSVALGYAALALGAATGVFGWRFVLDAARRLCQRERSAVATRSDQ